MFKRLRNKFLIFNMIMILATVLISFLTVYIAIYKNTYEENKEKVGYNNTAINVELNDGVGEVDQITVNGDSDISPEIMTPGNTLSFSVIVDSKGEFKNGSVAFMNLPPDVYKEAKDKAFKEKKDYSIIKLKDRSWMYKIIEEESDYRINFLDVTDSQEFLLELLYTFILVGLVMFIIVFFISLYSSNKSIQPVSDAFERQKQFIANASHELKTPLSIINANYDVLMMNKEETIESQIKWLDYMKIGTNRMSKLINNLLLLAKAENISEDVKKETFDLTKVIKEVMNMLEVNVKDKNITVIENINENINIKSNKSMIREVFVILYENAIKYTELNGKIEVNLYKVNQGLKCSVKNTTNNISDEDIPYLFDRFYRVDKSRKNDNGSYGLGLSIAKTTINNVNGSISVNYIDGWIEFNFYIPS